MLKVVEQILYWFIVKYTICETQIYIIDVLSNSSPSKNFHN